MSKHVHVRNDIDDLSMSKHVHVSNDLDDLSMCLSMSMLAMILVILADVYRSEHITVSNDLGHLHRCQGQNTYMLAMILVTSAGVTDLNPSNVVHGNKYVAIH